MAMEGPRPIKEQEQEDQEEERATLTSQGEEAALMMELKNLKTKFMDNKESRGPPSMQDVQARSSNNHTAPTPTSTHPPNSKVLVQDPSPQGPTGRQAGGSGNPPYMRGSRELWYLDVDSPHSNPAYPTLPYPSLPQKNKVLALENIWCLAKIRRLGLLILLLLQVPPHLMPAYSNPAYQNPPYPVLPQKNKVLALNKI